MEHQRYDRRRQARIRARRRRQIRRRLMMAGVFFLLAALGVSMICVRAYRKLRATERGRMSFRRWHRHMKSLRSLYPERRQKTDGEFAEWTVENCSAGEYGKLSAIAEEGELTERDIYDTLGMTMHVLEDRRSGLLDDAGHGCTERDIFCRRPGR